MFDNISRAHFKKFPVRVMNLRALADELDPWPTVYEGCYEKGFVPSSNGTQVEARSLYLRRTLSGGLLMKLGWFLTLGVIGSVFGFVCGFLMDMMFHVDYLLWVCVAGFLLMFGAIGFKIGTPVELFEIPNQPQGAYQSNKDSDILWLYQTDLNEFSPILFKNKQMVAQIMSLIPDVFETVRKTYNKMIPKMIEKLDENGNPVIDKKTKEPVLVAEIDLVSKKPVMVQEIDKSGKAVIFEREEFAPDPVNGHEIIDLQTGMVFKDALGNTKFRVKTWKKILTPKVIFDGNWYLGGDPKNPVLKYAPYAVAYKSSDLYQWLLLQADRQRFYILNDWWGKYGNYVAMLIAGVIIIFILAVGLNQYSQVTAQYVTAANGLSNSLNGYTAAFTHYTSGTVGNAATGAANPPH